VLRPFIARFLLPLVKGGSLHVGRPIDLTAVTDLAAAFAAPEELRAQRLLPADLVAASELGFLRARTSRALLLDAPPPPLDIETLRLGAALHDVLLLTHPSLGSDPTDRTRQRIAETAETLATLGPPASALAAVRRYSLLARLPEIIQPERVVTHWLGRHRFIGRTPPARLLALPRLRRVRLDETRRSWLREVGIAPLARPAWQALLTANPLAEALDPLRLEPPLSFARVLPVLRFPALGRIVASRVLDLGLVQAGSAFAAAIFRYASLRESVTGAVAPQGGVALGITFLAHLVWLHLTVRASAPTAALHPDADADADAPDGSDLADLLVAAAEVDPRLVFPPDVPPGSAAGGQMRALLDRWRPAVLARGDARYRLALGVAQHASRHFEAGGLVRRGISGI
jgi:hypothetical protein